MSKIIAIITIYFPNLNNIENIKKICEQVDYTYICDNSPSENTYLSELKKSKYIFNNKNLGLSSAFNKVLKENSFSENDYIIFFDQDSTISDNYISTLVQEYEKLETIGIKIGGIGPNFCNMASTSQNTYMVDKGDSKKVESLMTSSFLCKYKTLQEINFWNEEIFLDLSDWDLCWRLKEKGYPCYITPVVTLCHTLGKGEKKVGILRIKEGSPFRVYYQTRDCLRLINKSYVPFKYKIRFFLMLSVRPIVHFIFLGNKKERIKFFFKGIRDFKKGIYGSL